MSVTASWQLDGHVATLKVSGGEIAVDVAHPSLGLSRRAANSATHILNALGVVLGGQEPIAAECIDAFTRGRDLVATYEEGPLRHVRAQVYWRSLLAEEFSPTGAASVSSAFDLILSVNTSLLDEDPKSMVRTIVSPTSEAMNLRTAEDGRLLVQKVGAEELASHQDNIIASTPTGCFVFRFPGSGLSYIEMVHPVDYQQTDLLTGDSAPPRTQLAHQLFAQRLEKGVILRARVRAALVKRENDETAAIDGFQHFSASEPPLTV
jgi:hypothetical protein